VSPAAEGMPPRVTTPGIGPVAGGPGDGTRAVAVGGGHGVARTLAALPAVVDHVTAIVTVADDGGSSGRLRRDLDVLPPGDLRMALTTMSPHPELAEIIGYRFGRGELSGHSLGNLVLVALQDLSGGDIVVALDRLAALLGVPGRVLPCTTQAVTLLAATPDGGVTGQVAVAATPRLERVWLEPADAPGTPDAVAAIERADLIVLGPGSIYTSLLPNLLVPDIGAAVTAARAPVVFVANLREQPGETEGMTLVDHLDAITAHLPELRIDVVVAHEGARPTGGGEPMLLDREALEQRAGRVVAADLLDGADGHAPVALGRIFDRLLRG
jgi:uncharacterized cofD-like protein